MHCICHTAQSLSQYLVFIMLHSHCYVALPLSCWVTSVMLCCHSLQAFSPIPCFVFMLAAATWLCLCHTNFNALCLTITVMIPYLYNAALSMSGGSGSVLACLVLLDHCRVVRYLLCMLHLWCGASACVMPCYYHAACNTLSLPYKTTRLCLLR